MVDVSEKSGVALFIFSGLFNGENFTESSEGRLKWIRLEDIDRLPVVEDLLIILPKIVSFQSGDTPIIGKYIYSEDGELKILLR